MKKFNQGVFNLKSQRTGFFFFFVQVDQASLVRDFDDRSSSMWRSTGEISMPLFVLDRPLLPIPLGPRQRFLPYFRVPGSSGELRGITLERLSSLPSPFPFSLFAFPLPLYAALRSPSQPSHFPLFTLLRRSLINVDLNEPSFVGRFLSALHKTRLKAVSLNFPTSFPAILHSDRLKSSVASRESRKARENAEYTFITL